MRQHRLRSASRLGLTHLADCEMLESRLALAEVSGKVWNDFDRNGQRDKSSVEMRAPDVVVRLLDDRGNALQTTSTDAEGSYRFTNIYVGEYQLEFIPTDDTGFTEPDSGPDDKDSDVNPQTQQTAKFQIMNDTQPSHQLDAGLYSRYGTESIIGSVWNDINQDGIRTSNELPLPNVEVQLEYADGGKLLEVKTTPLGTFIFPGAQLLPGSYRLDFRRPNFPDDLWEISPQHPRQGNDPTQISDANPINGKTAVFRLAPLSSAVEVSSRKFSAGFFRAATISGTVWHDANANDAHDPGESGVYGQTLRLLDSSGTPVATTLTSETGQYRFAVKPGHYRVAADLSTTLLGSRQNQVHDLLDSDFDPVTGLTPLIEVTAAGTPYDLGLRSPFGAEDVRGRLWHDANADGWQDSNELGVANVEVKLQVGGLETIATTRTTADGSYFFAGSKLLPGTYNLNFKSASYGWNVSPRNVSGSQSQFDSDFHPVTGSSPPFVLPAASADSPRSVIARDAGLFRYATVRGQVWDDASENGILDAVEAVVSEVDVDLLLSDGTLVDRAITSLAGDYLFENVLPGRAYVVRIHAPHNTQMTVATASNNGLPYTNVNSITGRSLPFTALSQVISSYSAGLRGYDSTTGFQGIVWDDLNANGVRDDGEPGLPALSLRAVGPAGEFRATTNARGEYSIAGIPSGSYEIQVVPPQGMTLTPQDRGDDDTRDSDINRSQLKSKPYTLITSQVESTVDIGLYHGTLSTDVLQNLRISEVAFLGHGNPEFIEVKNVGDVPLDISDATFTKGVQFSFANSAITSLFPGEHAIVVGTNLNRLAAHFSVIDINVAGIYQGDLNRSEVVELRSAAHGDLISYLDYDDDWYVLMEDEYQPWTLTVMDERADSSTWNTKQNWRPSSYQGGSPGRDDPRATPDPGAVVINEVMTMTADFFNDVIELYNTTDEDIPIGNWYLGDREKNDPQGENLMRYRIAPDTIIRAHDYLVFSRQTHFANPTDPGLVTEFGLSSFGEGVHLIAADALGQSLGYSDSAYFPASEIDQSFGRMTLSDGSSTFVVMSQPTIGGPNSAAASGPLVIDQLMYHPGSELGEEYIRIRNTTDAAIDLNTDMGSWQVSGAVAYSFTSDVGAQVPAGGHMLLVPVDPQYFRDTFGIPSSIPIFGPFAGALDNQGEAIVLSRPGSENRELWVDRVTYDRDGSWPSEANAGSVALMRVSDQKVGDEPANWIASSVPIGTHLGNGIFVQESFVTLAAAVYGHNVLGIATRKALAGDANGDNRFNSRDLVTVFQAGLYLRDSDATWLEGDWNGDGRFTQADLVAAFQVSTYDVT